MLPCSVSRLVDKRFPVNYNLLVGRRGYFNSAGYHIRTLVGDIGWTGQLRYDMQSALQYVRRYTRFTCTDVISGIVYVTSHSMRVACDTMNHFKRAKPAVMSPSEKYN